MKHLQSFRDKIKEYEDATLKMKKLSVELREDSKNIVYTIVDILDEMTPNNGKKAFNVDIKTNGKKIFKIENDKTIMNDDREKYLHSNGTGTNIYWINENDGTKDNNILWNMNARDEYYNELVDILDSLIKKFNKEYKIVLLKKDSKKYNL